MPKKDTINMSLVTAELESASDLVAAQVKAGLNPDEVVQKGFTSISSMLSKIKNQECIFFENMIDQDTWARLRHKGIENPTRMQMIANVASKIGVIRPNETTLFRMSSIAAYCSGELAWTQNDVFKSMDTIKMYLKSMKSPIEEYIAQYPSSFADLSGDVQESYVSDGSKVPIDVDIPELDSVLAGKKKMGRSKDDYPEWLDAVPAQYRPALAAMLRKEQASSSSSNKHDPSTDVDATDEEHRIQSFVDTVKKLRTPVGVPVYRRLTSKSPQIGINAGPPQRMSTNESGHEGFNHDDEVVKKEELESELKFEPEPTNETQDQQVGHGDLSTMEKKILAASKAKVKSNAMRRPAGVRKRPAAEELQYKDPNLAKNINMTDIFKRLRDNRHAEGMYRNKFRSTAYSKARKRAIDYGATSTDATLFARACASQASSMWEKTM